MKAIHKKRLLKLADHLQNGKLGHKYFSFDVINSNEKYCVSTRSFKKDNQCGTYGCALGELPFVFPRSFQFNKDNVADKGLKLSDSLYFDNFAKFFGIDPEETEHLFVPICQSYHQYGGSKLPDYPTAKRIAKHIRDFLKINYPDKNEK